MESLKPPSYEEATDDHKDWTPPNVVNDPSEVCNNCGVVTPVGKYCSYCGQVLVQTTQPVPSTARVQILSIHLPPITPVQQAAEAQQQPPSPDIKHKYDMAYKQGARLIYDFEKAACCPGQVVGLDPNVKDAIPYELEQKGITKAQWHGWMEKLMENQRRAPSIVGCLCMFCVPGFIPQSILCAMLCPISMDHCFKWLPCCYGDWYSGLRTWQEEVNSVLNRHDMHVKLMTYKPKQKAPQSRLHGSRVAGKDHNYEMSMMVISLTEAETEKLKMESWDHGVNDGCTSGIGRLL